MKRANPKQDEIVDEILQIIAFNVGPEEFGVDIMQVQEIIRMEEATRIPNAPDHFRGIINLRGRVIVVTDLDRRLGIDAKELDENSRIIVVEVDDAVIGMTVNSVSGVLRIPTSCIESTPEIIASKIKADYIKGVGKVDERLLVMLDLEKVLTEEEIEEAIEIETMDN